jgi:hypothetical protein
MEAAGLDPAKAEKLKSRDELRVRIVTRIQEITAENSGTPPGLEQFAKKSGIKRSFYIGRIWATWGEALREAGFTPNGPNRRLDDDEMLAAVAGVARLLGRIPSVSELKVYRAAGRDLPCPTAYTHHFGNKQGMLRGLKRWSAASAERADIAAMLGDIPDLPDAKAQIRGAVYLLQCGRAFKIGCSRTPDQRIGNLQRALPAAAKLVHVIDTDDPYGVESYWHRRFADKRLRGEWFRLAKEDVAAFRAMRFR